MRFENVWDILWYKFFVRVCYKIGKKWKQNENSIQLKRDVCKMFCNGFGFVIKLSTDSYTSIQNNKSDAHWHGWPCLMR